MRIAIYTLTSELHDESAVEAVTREFLSSLNLDYTLKGNHYDDYGSHALSLIYVRTGGTEGIFLRLLPQLQALSTQPFYLLTSGKSNSLAASMEILSYLRQHAIKGEIIHGNADYISQRIRQLATVAEARLRLRGSRFGIIGKPSDWLISSHADADIVRQQLGIDLVNISLPLTPSKREGGLLSNGTTAAYYKGGPQCVGPAAAYYEGAERIYDALKELVERYQLKGFTLRCFDLLTAIHNTGCLALARLNSEGIVAGCEGDVPAMLSMAIVQSLTGVSGFQANPSSIDPETGELLFAHCTIPLNMVERYELDTHFESGIGVGIRGFMRQGPVTIFKLSGDLSRSFIAEGELVRNEQKPDLCRTQQVILLSDRGQASYFLSNPIGNHHIIVPGCQGELLRLFTSSLS